MKSPAVTGVFSALVAAFSLAAVVPATAQDYVIPLPELTGYYHYHWSEQSDDHFKETVITLDLDIVSIPSMVFRVAGDWYAGTQFCENQGVIPADTGLVMFLRAPSIDGYEYADIWEMESGAIDTISRPFGGAWPPDNFDFLVGETIEIKLQIDAYVLGVCTPIEDAWATLDEVELILEGAVPVRWSSWSSIKSVYR